MKQDGFVHLLNAANGESMGKLQNFSSKVTSIRFSSDDRLLAVGDTGYKLKLWDVEKREVIFFTFKNFFYSIYIFFFIYSLYLINWCITLPPLLRLLSVLRTNSC